MHATGSPPACGASQQQACPPCNLRLFVCSQRDGTLSAGRSAYINYSGMLQQFVQAYISKQQAMNVHEAHLILQKVLQHFQTSLVQHLISVPLRVPLRGKGRCAARPSLFSSFMQHRTISHRFFRTWRKFQAVSSAATGASVVCTGRAARFLLLG